MAANLTNIDDTNAPPVNVFSTFPYRQEYAFVSSILSPTQFVLLIAGLFSNAVNIIVFIKSGVKDSVTTLLLALSISDGTFLVLFTPSTIRGAFSKFGLTRMSTLSTIHLLFFWPAFTMYDFSSYISVFLGVTRCACVAMPLRFKTIFTTKRTVVSLFVLFCADVLLHLPMLTVFRLGLVIDPMTNTSSLSLVRDGFSDQLFKQKINDIVNKNTIPWISFIIMVACVTLLSFKLFESSKIRSNPSGNHDISQDSSIKSPEKNQVVAQSHKLTPRDLKVVQCVVLVCSIFIAFQLPSLIYTSVRATNPEFNVGGRLLFLAAICIQISYASYFLNASVNILVYYNYNSRYRAVFRSLFNLKDYEENTKTSIANNHP